MRFWLWLTTGMVTKQWVAIHRKHHQRSDQEGDPHSPHVFGIWTVFFKGALLYNNASKDVKMIEQFGVGTPDDWI
jgi:stearoyl-CoA desaturase (delta-9 desaturase)